MKKEIKAILNSDDAYLDLNPLFHLHHKKFVDCFGRHQDQLWIEMKNLGLCPKNSSYQIMERDIPGIQKACAECMDLLMDSYKEQLINRFIGGRL